MSKRQKLVEKWSSEAMGKMSIANIPDQFIKENIARVLENQMSKDWNGQDILLEDSSQAGNTSVTFGSQGYSFPAGTQDSDSWKFRPIAMALVRRVLPELFANKTVGVQAMSTPVGLAFALRMIYKTATGATADPSVQEAAWDNVDYYGGFTGSTPAASAALDTSIDGIYDSSATGAALSAAELWNITGSYYPQIRMRLDKVSIEAQSRKLGASFSLESAQDIRAMHDIDIEREMINILHYESLAELDRELVYRMKIAATDTSKGGTRITAINCASGGNLDGRWSQEKYANIVAAIINQANQIAVKTRRGPGNFCICSPNIASILQASGHHFTRLKSGVEATTTVAEIGVLNDQMKVYRDIYARTDYALVGFKGPGISDCGIIFSPYIMGLESRAVSPEDFSPRIGVMSRYSITDSLLQSGRYYRLLPFSNVSSILAGA
jgi:hypothetical protein